jgi:hypothetical protein
LGVALNGRLVMRKDIEGTHETGDCDIPMYRDNCPRDGSETCPRLEYDVFRRTD